jgi:hypothetical protein
MADVPALPGTQDPEGLANCEPGRPGNQPLPGAGQFPRPARSKRSCRVGLRACRVRNSRNRRLNASGFPSRSASAFRSCCSDTARSYSPGRLVSIHSAAFPGCGLRQQLILFLCWQRRHPRCQPGGFLDGRARGRRRGQEILVDFEEIHDRLKPGAQVAQASWHRRLGVVVVQLVPLQSQQPGQVQQP